MNDTAQKAQKIRRLEAEVHELKEELMRKDTLPDYERGELAGQDAMMRHVAKLDETNNSALARAVRECPLYKSTLERIAQLECRLAIQRHNTDTPPMFPGACMGVNLVPRADGDKHICFELYVEDDTIWHRKMSASSAWLDELIEQLQKAKAYVETQEPDIYSYDGKQYGWRFK